MTARVVVRAGGARLISARPNGYRLAIGWLSILNYSKNLQTKLFQNSTNYNHQLKLTLTKNSNIF
jgi:hypothetical protein